MSSSSESDAQTLAELLQAARQDDLATLRAILDAHPDLVNAVGPTGRRPLSEADYGYWPEGVAFLSAGGRS
jgi:hypothetical protein